MGHLKTTGKPQWVQDLHDCENLWIKEFGSLDNGPLERSFEEINGRNYAFGYDFQTKTTIILSDFGKITYVGNECPIQPSEPDDYYPNTPEADQYEKEVEQWAEKDYQFFIKLIEDKGI